MSKKNLSIALSLIGGFLVALLSFFMLSFCNLGWIGTPTQCWFLYYIGGVGLFAILGALIEFKSLIAGSVICLISGVLGIIFAVMIARISMSGSFSILPYNFLIPFFLIIAGGALGTWDFLQQP
jgi:tryptophan-rich sensory protein